MPGCTDVNVLAQERSAMHRNVAKSCALCRSDAIYSAKYDGSGLIEVLRGHEYLSHPFAVTMYGGEVYWTDWRTNTLAKANKWTGSNVTVVQRTNTQPFDLQVYHPSRQPLGRKYTCTYTHTHHWGRQKQCIVCTMHNFTERKAFPRPIM